ncbi:MAG: N-acetylmuramoyl-L-alanine amidase [Paludibacteraceae bacterium]|nr:N-acetylmuramoyl-L-alanine amidase [Paludibacteraceae bacterium]
MKRLLIILSILLQGVTYLGTEVLAQTKKPFVIVIDAGHGGKDNGASGKKKLKEKDINLSVALKLGEQLEKVSNVKVYYTRKTDVFVPLDDRAQFANNLNANLFISIHTNASENRDAQGTEVYSFSTSSSDIAMRENAVMELEENYKKKYDGFDPNSSESYIQWDLVSSDFGFSGQSKELANTISKQLTKYSGLKSRGIHQAGFWVLKYSKMPGVLVEVGYVSNLEEEKFLRKETSHQKLATAIYKAVVQYKNEYEKKAAANAKDVKEDAKKQTAALRYSVQFYTGARKSINAKEFKSCVPARESDLGKGIYSYTYGNEQTYEKAKELLAKVRKDFSDAFLVVYKNGERLTREQARQYMK